MKNFIQSVFIVLHIVHAPIVVPLSPSTISVPSSIQENIPVTSSNELVLKRLDTLQKEIDVLNAKVSSMKIVGDTQEKSSTIISTNKEIEYQKLLDETKMNYEINITKDNLDFSQAKIGQPISFKFQILSTPPSTSLPRPIGGIVYITNPETKQVTQISISNLDALRGTSYWSFYPKNVGTETIMFSIPAYKITKIIQIVVSQ